MVSTDDTGFLQQRVALFGLVMGLLGTAGFVVRATLHLIFGNALSSFLSMSWGAHFAAALLPLGLWLILRSGDRPRPRVHLLETLVLWGATVCYLQTGLHLSDEARPDYVVILVLNVLFLARAVYVPSSARRTLMVTGVVAIPMVAMIYLDLSPRVHEPAIPSHAPWSRAMNALIWWSFITALASLTSRTIYGLRRQVREARRLGQYSLEERIAEGGMGEIYRARHGLLRRPTAVKLIRREKVGERALSRFEREARLTASLTHPNTVTIFDYGRTDDGVFYCAMELLDGPDLQQVIDATGPMALGRACRILAQVASALAEAHEAGLIHRDVKPANVLLVERGGAPDVAKVVDFGLVLEVRGDPEASEAGLIIGTPLYLSPEAITKANPIDPRSDLYALGALAYFVLTGKPVFDADSVLEVYGRHLSEAPTAPSEARGEPLPMGLDRLVLDCLEKNPAHRPQSAREVMVRFLACADECMPWDEHDARTWWRDHRDVLEAARSRRAEMSEPVNITIARDRNASPTSIPPGTSAS